MPTWPCRHAASQACTQWERAAARIHTSVALALPLNSASQDGRLMAALRRRQPHLTQLDMSIQSAHDLPSAGLLACLLPRLHTLFLANEHWEACQTGRYLPWPEVGMPPLPPPPWLCCCLA